MKHDEAAIVLRPRTVTEVVDLSCRLCFSLALRLHGKLAAIVLLPIFGLAMGLHYYEGLAWPMIWGGVVLLGCVAQGVFTVAAGRLLFAQSTAVGQVLRSFVRRLPAFLFAQLAKAAVLAVGALPFLLGLPFVAVAMLFVPEAAVLEQAGPVQACQRASRFVQGRRWAALQILLLLLIGHAGAVVIAELLGQSVLDDLFQLGRPLGSLWLDGGSPFALLGFLLAIPFIATTRFLYYIDTRTRTDGWDIQVRFMAIAARDAAQRSLPR